jgi:hypothetical protein
MYGILRGKKKLVIPKSFPQCAAELLSCFVLIGKGQGWSETGFKSGDSNYWKIQRAPLNVIIYNVISQIIFSLLWSFNKSNLIGNCIVQRKKEFGPCCHLLLVIRCRGQKEPSKGPSKFYVKSRERLKNHVFGHTTCFQI